MELATLVYWIGVLNPLAHFLIFIFVLLFRPQGLFGSKA